MFSTSEKHTFTISRYRPRHLSFKLTHSNSWHADTHTNIHTLNMCPADVVAMKQGPVLCVYMRESARGKESKRNRERDKKYLKNANIWGEERREIKWTLILPQQFPLLSTRRWKSSNALSDIYFSLNTRLEFCSGTLGLAWEDRGTQGPLSAWFTN